MEIMNIINELCSASGVSGSEAPAIDVCKKYLQGFAELKTDSNGNRWIGDGVTWRGLIGGTFLGTIAGAIQGYFGPEIMLQFGQYITTPIAIGVTNGIIIGFLLGFGALIGDAIGSFIKRRVGIGRGKPAPLLDQLDFLVVSLLFASAVVKFDLKFIIISFALTLIIHLIANTGAYLLGIKDVWY